MTRMNQLVPDSEFPLVFRAQQSLPRERVQDISQTVRQQLRRLELAGRIRSGESVAITAGSRGIANIASILTEVVAHLRELGAEPFLFPAMGSHGGATAEGQLAVLEGYEITAADCGCPIRATMETVEALQTRHGFSVHVDRLAHEADHILVVGRVKPHTMFVGPVESGICKMLLIGMGKQRGAKTYHAAIQAHSFPELIDAAIPPLLEKLPICGALAIVENAFEETACIEGLRPEEILTREPELLELSKQWMARLPFDEIDVLVIDEIGKNISGTGLDTNVVGRKFDDNKAVDGERPSVLRIVARSLTADSHGNATGVGIVDFMTRRLHEAIDLEKVNVNCITAGHIGAAKLPPVFASDREAIAAALSCIGLREPRDARLVRIKNTLELIDLTCSAAYLDEVARREELLVRSEPQPMAFAADGALL